MWWWWWWWGGGGVTALRKTLHAFSLSKLGRSVTSSNVLHSKYSTHNKRGIQNFALSVLKAWVKKQYELSNLVLLSAGLGQRQFINKLNGRLSYLVFGCPLTAFVLLKLGLLEFIFPNK